MAGPFWLLGTESALLSVATERKPLRSKQKGPIMNARMYSITLQVIFVVTLVFTAQLQAGSWAIVKMDKGFDSSSITERVDGKWEFGEIDFVERWGKVVYENKARIEMSETSKDLDGVSSNTEFMLDEQPHHKHPYTGSYGVEVFGEKLCMLHHRDTIQFCTAVASQNPKSFSSDWFFKVGCAWAAAHGRAWKDGFENARFVKLMAAALGAQLAKEGASTEDIIKISFRFVRQLQKARLDGTYVTTRQVFNIFRQVIGDISAPAPVKATFGMGYDWKGIANLAAKRAIEIAKNPDEKHHVSQARGRKLGVSLLGIR